MCDFKKDSLTKTKMEHSGSGDVVLQLKLEIQKLTEESVLAKSLNTTRQRQVDSLNSQLSELSTKLEEV